LTQRAPAVAPEAVAVVGLAGRFPGARDVEAFWRNLEAGVDSISRPSDDELLAAGVEAEILERPDYVRAASYIEDVDAFDAGFFDVGAREAEVLDPQQRLLLECAWEALESAGHDPRSFDGRIGIYAGGRISDYFLYQILAHPEVIETVGRLQILFGNDKDYLTTFVAYKLGLTGPSIAVQTACSSALVSVHLACESLHNLETDMAIAGGVSVRLPDRAGYVYHEGGLLSPDGRCRSFDARAAGTVFGNGVGAVVLRRLNDALEDRDPIRAVLLGSAVNNDGDHKVGFAAPSEEGQSAVITEALEVAGVDPDQISYVEAHGSGTALGDPIELAALDRAFRRRTERRGFCALGSVKSNLGHLEAAAGVAGLIKTVLALEHRRIPPSLHFERPNPRADLEASPFFVNTESRPWDRPDGPRRAGVSSFGLGGTNAHVVVEEAPEPPPSGPSREWQLLPLSARSAGALEAATDRLAELLRRQDAPALADVAHTYQLGRRRFDHRRVVVCRDREDALRALDRRDPTRLLEAVEGRGERPVAFLLPGLGEHYPGMARGLYRHEPDFRAALDRCAELLRPRLEVELTELLFPETGEAGEEEADAGGVDLRRLLGRGEPAGDPAALRLRRPTLAHPAVFAVEYALAQLWISWGVQPRALLGYSLGEYAAACLAGVLSLPDALEVVVERARLVEALPSGVMLAVPLPEEELCRELGDHLDLAAVNGPGDCVVAGGEPAIAELERRLDGRGVVSRRLETDRAFHSRALRPIFRPLADRLRRIELAPPRIPYLSGVTGGWIEDRQAVDPEHWAEHSCATVRFGDGLVELLRDPEQLLLEVGPGQSLGVVARRHPGRDAGQPVLTSLRHRDYRGSDLAHLLTTLGHLWLAGVAVDWRGFARHEERRRVPAPTYPFERRRYWIEGRRGAAAADAPSAGAAAERATADRATAVHADPDRWLWAPVWRQAPAPATDGEPPGEWLILSDGGELAELLAARLTATGRRVVTAVAADGEPADGEPMRLRPGVRADYGALLDRLHAAGRFPEVVVHLWSLGPERDERTERERGFDSLLDLARAFGRHTPERPVELLVVAEGVADVTGEEPLVPGRGTLLGPVRVIPQEYPRLRCRLIDVAPGAGGRERLAERLIAEAPVAPGAPWLALRGRHRWQQDFAPLPPPPAEVGDGVRHRGVYLITGGLGGVGLELAEGLARAAAARLILLGRSPFPPRREWDAWTAEHGADDDTSRKIARLRHIEEAGAEVETASADVARREQLEPVIAAIAERHGGLDGVFHLAGLPGGGMIQLQTPDETAPVLAAKVEGTELLWRLVAALEPDFFVLFSSILSTLGGVGQVAYCAANGYLDLFAQARSRDAGTRFLAVGWDRWLEVGMAAGEGTEGGIPPRRGVELLLRLLGGATPPRLVASVRELPPLVRRALEEPAAGVEIAARELARRGLAASHPRPELRTPYAPPAGELEERLATLWQELLGVSRVGVHDNFFELGGDSVRGLQLVALARQRGLELTTGQLFEYPTVARLAAVLEGAAVADEASADKPVAGEEPADDAGEERLERSAQRFRVGSEELDQLADLYGDPGAEGDPG